MTVKAAVAFDRTQLRRDVLAAHDAGLCVLPVATDGSKRRWGEWKRDRARRQSRDAVRAWFMTDQYDGVGIVCGAVSGNVECLELEGRAVVYGVYTAFVEALRAAGLGNLFDRV